MLTKLLASEATPWERAFAETLDTIGTVEGAVAGIRGAKLVAPPVSFLPFLVYEYGLGELQPYVPNLYELLADGVDWQRIRGTHAAVAMGLDFVGYQAAIEEALSRRVFWNSFQLRFPTLPAADAPDLDQIDGIATLSVPKRSVFRRGVHVYDVTPMETDEGLLDQTLLETESGIRLRAGGPLWSFGRVTEVDHVLTQAEGEAIGNWVDPIDTALTWEDMDFPWEDATFPWLTEGEVARQVAMAGWFEGRAAYVGLRDDDGVIGYRRALCAHRVKPLSGGKYRHGALRYEPSDDGIFAYIAARTGFGDAEARTASEAFLLLNAERATGVPAGKLWCAPDDIVGGDEIATTATNIPLRRTVREEIKFLLRF